MMPVPPERSFWDAGCDDVGYDIEAADGEDGSTEPRHYTIDDLIARESWWECDTSEIAECLECDYEVGHNDRYICIDDAYKVNIGREKYLRVALVEFEKGEDMSPYLHGDRDAFRQKMKEGKMRQLDIVMDSWSPDEDDFVADVTNRAIAQMAAGNPVDIYACNFFKSYIEGPHEDIVFASGHKPNPYRPYVKVADVATKWMDDGEPSLADFVRDVDRYWQDNPGVRGQDSFELDGRTVLVSDEVTKRYRQHLRSEKETFARAA